MTIDDLKKSVTELEAEEGLSLILSVRNKRSSRSQTKKRKRRKKAKKQRKSKRQLKKELMQHLAKLSDEEKQALLQDQKKNG